MKSKRKVVRMLNWDFLDEPGYRDEHPYLVAYVHPDGRVTARPVCHRTPLKEPMAADFERIFGSEQRALDVCSGAQCKKFPDMDALINSIQRFVRYDRERAPIFAYRGEGKWEMIR